MAEKIGHGKVLHVGGRTPVLDTDDERAWAYGFTCGHCGATGSAAVVSATVDGNITPLIRWVRCVSCGEGAVIAEDGTVSPGVAGQALEGLPDDVEAAHLEARRCLSIGAFTGCELVCRKLLMYVAVSAGASEGETFASYIDFLKAKGFVTEPLEPWVKAVKDNGNEAAHKLPHPTRQRAEVTLTFVTQMLRTIYEMPFKLAQSMPAPPPGDGDA